MVKREKKDRINVEPLIGRRGAMKYTNPDWGTIAFFIPKFDFVENPKFNDVELSYNCIYFLVGYESTTGLGSVEKMYVGQAGIRDCGESVIKRTMEHLKNACESYYDKWDYIVVMTNERGEWGSTEIDALEYLFWSFIPVGNRFNGKLPSSKGADLSLYADITNQIKAYLTKMQFSMFSTDTEKKTEEQVQKIAAAKSDKPVDLNDGIITVPDITTPKWVVKKMIDMLPQQLFDNPDVKFLDPACKAGEYLEEIFSRCMKSEKHRMYFQHYGKPEIAQAMHILTKQIFGIALTPNSLKIASEKLNGSSNIILIPNYIYKIKYSDSIIGVLEKEFNREMKIDVVIGNPPYNDTETKKATAIYSDFVLKFKDMAKYLSFITPARWYSGGRGKSLNELRRTLLAEGHLERLVDFPNCADVFTNSVNINGGVCYYLYNKDYTGDCKVKQIRDKKIIYDINRDLRQHSIFIRDVVGLDVIEKIKLINSGNYYLSEIAVQSVDCFNVKDNVAVHGYYSEGDTKIVDAKGYLYAKREFLNNQRLIDCYNVIVTHAVGSNGYVIPNTTRILEKGEACSVTYLCIGGTADREKAERLLKYIKSRFVRFLILQTISGQNISASSFMFVPVQKFDETDGIDWLRSIAGIDEQLYKKYNLTMEEIAYIEKMVRPMNDLTAQDAMAAYVNKAVQNDV